MTAFPPSPAVQSIIDHAFSCAGDEVIECLERAQQIVMASCRNESVPLPDYLDSVTAIFRRNLEKTCVALNAAKALAGEI